MPTRSSRGKGSGLELGTGISGRAPVVVGGCSDTATILRRKGHALPTLMETPSAAWQCWRRNGRQGTVHCMTRRIPVDYTPCVRPPCPRVPVPCSPQAPPPLESRRRRRVRTGSACHNYPRKNQNGGKIVSECGNNAPARLSPTPDFRNFRGTGHRNRHQHRQQKSGKLTGLPDTNRSCHAPHPPSIRPCRAVAKNTFTSHWTFEISAVPAPLHWHAFWDQNRSTDRPRGLSECPVLQGRHIESSPGSLLT